MPSFDVVCKPNLVELRNALELTAYGDDDFKLGQVRDVLMGKLAKRGVDPRLLEFGKAEKIGGDKLKQAIKVRNGIDSVLAKKIVGMVKESRIKVSSSIQGDAVRVSGAKKDALQEVIALLRRDVTEVPLTFENFRD
jgi:uncharacterized protein YajQ (UPF0234 family)